MPADARLSTTLPAHPKTKKLLRRGGPEAAWSLVCLFLWVAGNRSDGDLQGLTDEDIELAAEWNGAASQFVKLLTDVGFLDGTDGAYTIHDWADHNPWAAGAGERSAASKWAALCKRYGREIAAERMPEYAHRIRPAQNNDAEGTRGVCPDTASVSASVTETPPKAPQGGRYTVEFEAWWAVWPNKVGKDAAWKIWKKRKDKPPLEELIGAVKRYVASKPADREWCNPATWLSQGRWLDEPAKNGPSEAVYNGPIKHTDEFWKLHYRRFLGREQPKYLKGHWPAYLGPTPDSFGCEIPRNVREEIDKELPNFLKRSAA